MRILITGNMGYVGPAVVAHLRERYPHCELLGFDSGLFAGHLEYNRTDSGDPARRAALW